MKLRPMMLAGLSLLFVSSQQAKCPCKDDPTLPHGWGGHMTGVLTERALLKSLEGVVTDRTGAALEGALVQVFDHPEASPHKDDRSAGVEQKRVAACLAGADGKFCFDRIPPGRYELRIHVEGFNPASVFIELNPKHRRSVKKIIPVELEAGT